MSAVHLRPPVLEAAGERPQLLLAGLVALPGLLDRAGKGDQAPGEGVQALGDALHPLLEQARAGGERLSLVGGGGALALDPLQAAADLLEPLLELGAHARSLLPGAAAQGVERLQPVPDPLHLAGEILQACLQLLAGACLGERAQLGTNLGERTREAGFLLVDALGELGERLGERSRPLVRALPGLLDRAGEDGQASGEGVQSLGEVLHPLLERLDGVPLGQAFQPAELGARLDQRLLDAGDLGVEPARLLVEAGAQGGEPCLPLLRRGGERLGELVGGGGALALDPLGKGIEARGDLMEAGGDLAQRLAGPLLEPGRSLGELLDREPELRDVHGILRDPELGDGVRDLVDVFLELAPERGELAVTTRETGRSRRDRLVEHVEPLTDRLDLAVHVVLAGGSRLGRERGDLLAKLVEADRARRGAHVGRQLVEPCLARLEGALEAHDLAVLRREGRGRGRDRLRQHGETVVHDADAVLDAVLELRVVLGQRLDRLAELLGGLLVAGRHLRGA